MLKDATDKQSNQLFINQKKINIMRTLDNNQISNKLKSTKGNIWNAKRRYR